MVQLLPSILLHQCQVRSCGVVRCNCGSADPIRTGVKGGLPSLPNIGFTHNIVHIPLVELYDQWEVFKIEAHPVGILFKVVKAFME